MNPRKTTSDCFVEFHPEPTRFFIYRRIHFTERHTLRRRVAGENLAADMKGLGPEGLTGIAKLCSFLDRVNQTA